MRGVSSNTLLCSAVYTGKEKARSKSCFAFCDTKFYWRSNRRGNVLSEGFSQQGCCLTVEIVPPILGNAIRAYQLCQFSVAVSTRIDGRANVDKLYGMLLLRPIRIVTLMQRIFEKREVMISVIRSTPLCFGQRPTNTNESEFGF